MTALAGDTPSSRALLRSRARSRRRAVPPACRRLAAQRVAAQARLLARRLKLRHCGCYLPHGSELDSGPIIAALLRQGVQVYLPVVRGRRMHFRRWDGGPLRRGAFGIREPLATPCRSASALDAIFLPLLAYDDLGSRLGSGGGFYDRYLARHRHRPRPLRIGLAFSAQRSPEALPRAQWDVPLHGVLTERGLRWTPAAGGAQPAPTAPQI